MTKSFRRMAAMAVTGYVLSGCAAPEIAPHLRPLPKETMMLLGKLGTNLSAPIFIRIFKDESELEIWKQGPDGRYYHVKTYPICNWSGDLGPKVAQGDRQSPEGFYTVSKGQMNPSSSFYLAFNLGYPNNFDKSHRRTGDFLMVHGKCRSAGCYAMTDALMEEIYALARESFAGGQDAIHVHAFPFRMTPANLERHKSHRWFGFWTTLKEGYDHFETTRQVPAVTVCERRYLVNVRFKASVPGRIDPEARCPAFERMVAEPFVAPKTHVAMQPVVVPGVKMRSLVAGTGAVPAAAAPAAASPVMGLGVGGAAEARP